MRCLFDIVRVSGGLHIHSDAHIPFQYACGVQFMREELLQEFKRLIIQLVVETGAPLRSHCALAAYVVRVVCERIIVWCLLFFVVLRVVCVRDGFKCFVNSGYVFIRWL